VTLGLLAAARRAGLCGLALALTVAPAAAASRPVVPWLDERPVKASAHPELAPSCRATDLHAHLFLQGATGSLVGGVELTNAAATACSLLGRPGIAFTGAAAAASHWRVRAIARLPEPLDVLADPPGSLRALQPGRSASVTLFWSNWCGPGSQPTGASGTPPAGLELRLESGTSVAVPLARAPRCDAQQHPSTLSVAPFTPTVRRLPTSSRLPLRVAISGERPVTVKPGLRAFRVHRGAELRYTVSVTNTGDRAFRFAPSSCPVYIESLPPGVPEAYVLNCRPVGVIAAHATARFAMRIRIPARARVGNNSLTWELAPRTYLAPFAPAAVWVVP
jgi:hypothetical protein